MRHKVKKVKLNLRTERRRSVLGNLATSLVLYEKVQTTVARARAVSAFLEHLITIVKTKDKVNAIRTLNKSLYDKNASRKMMEKLRDRYKDKNSGFLRTTNIRIRQGDNAKIVQIELI